MATGENRQTAQTILERLKEAMVEVDATEVDRLITEGLERHISSHEMIQKGLIPGINAVGEAFAKGNLFLPELVLAGEVMKAGLSRLLPLIGQNCGRALKAGKVVLGTVEGDIHDLGKHIVASLLQAAGFEVIDIGVSVPARKFVAAVEEHKPDILGLSALLTIGLPRQREVIDTLAKTGLRGKTKVIIGAAATSRAWADEIGADAYGGDAAEAVRLIRDLVQQLRKGEE